jgi:hypothetical protein
MLENESYYYNPQSICIDIRQEPKSNYNNNYKKNTPKLLFDLFLTFMI